MITQIKGRLIEKSPTELVIDCNGVGYSINISLNTYSQISDDENIKLFTHLIIKEDSHSLYGFFKKSERSLFKLLISVSGVGASTARMMLSSLSPGEIISQIILCKDYINDWSTQKKITNQVLTDSLPCKTSKQANEQAMERLEHKHTKVKHKDERTRLCTTFCCSCSFHDDFPITETCYGKHG